MIDQNQDNDGDSYGSRLKMEPIIDFTADTIREKEWDNIGDMTKTSISLKFGVSSPFDILNFVSINCSHEKVFRGNFPFEMSRFQS